MTRNPDLVRALAEAECKMKLPRTQEDCCDIAARIVVTIHGPPDDDQTIILSARAIALGLFGKAFEQTIEGQKWDLIDMCERSLRKAIKDFI